jgi:AraC-like DNA-binding protein
MGACAVAEQAGIRGFIAIDMGGTSYEACLVREARPTIESFWNWRHRYLIGLPMVPIHSIGAGGGSIARVEAGALRVGPESAGADPGPVCYGRGGKHPTVTDANLVLGYLNPEALCGGEFKLASAGVREVIRERVGRPLGLDAVEAAQGIFRIVNANMANAIRRVSSQAGLDPRDYTLVVYGGNGPIHAGMQAEDLGIRRLLVPKTSPAFSALGLLLADYLVDAKRPLGIPPRGIGLNGPYQTLEDPLGRTIRRGALRVRHLERELEIGERRLERLFRERVGVPPKLFARIVRFRAAFGQLAQGQPQAAVALDGGYADQAHMLREFREFAGTSPSRCFSALRGGNPSARRMAHGVR